MRQDGLQQGQREQEEWDGGEAVHDLTSEERLLHDPMVVLDLWPRGDDVGHDPDAAEEHGHVVDQEVADVATGPLGALSGMPGVDVALQLLLALLLGAPHEGEGAPDQDDLQQPAHGDDRIRRSDPWPRLAAIVPIHLRRHCDAIDELEEADDATNDAMGDELRPFELQDERHELKGVSLVDNQEDAQEDDRGRRCHGDQRAASEDDPNRVLDLAPDRLVIRVDVVSEERSDAIWT
mmetsp:Transcript_51152/g.143779  ORF Transcript_51152/g.143779 Transcript_51152/m.143779 type:complete len:236 (+) Transcript_51152:379-1086(+)